MKKLLSGNEAVARGAFEAGVKLAAAYPGTPSTEILENVAKHFPSIYCEWSPNEKVAFEVGIGGSLGGGRSLVTMKHVGVNVAADPLMTFSYTGVNGGFVFISADDPEMHSSQNEQDNRYFAKFAQIPFLEPSDSQESKDMVLLAFEISEQFDTPVMLRMTTRISHSKGLVETSDPIELGEQNLFDRDVKKYVMVPGHARARHKHILDRTAKLAEYVENSPLNKVESYGTKLGIISGGISYQYAKDIMPETDILKIGIGYPLPNKMIKEFVDAHERVIIVEELEPYYEEAIRIAGIHKIEGKKYFSREGELSPYRVAKGLQKAGVVETVAEPGYDPTQLFPRPPVLCVGCPHRGFFAVLKKLKLTVTGDIGCYTLGTLQPLGALHSCICMGASIGNAIGMEKVNGSKEDIVAVLGDSTFLHSGITGVLDAVYNQSDITIIIADNRITAMTGGQQHPATGYTLMGKKTKSVDIAELCKALGVESVRTVDPLDYDETMTAVKEEIKRPGPSVIITNRPCVLMPKPVYDTPYEVILDECNGCSACFRIGCPAILPSKEMTKKNRPKAEIDPVLCNGCSLCAQVCKPEAIVLTKQPEAVK
ncbi:MAG: indolepyruvate ferredoxin oxidoreductase subunit alpha [candidate division Zixibacteria bacterium]|nr:indolepyruvate ferredoxin oxidoreductase subunit alpha [candidate division Zixibacteria bacterium]